MKLVKAENLVAKEGGKLVIFEGESGALSGSGEYVIQGGCCKKMGDENGDD